MKRVKRLSFSGFMVCGGLKKKKAQLFFFCLPSLCIMYICMWCVLNLSSQLHLVSFFSFFLFFSFPFHTLLSDSTNVQKR